MKAGIGFGEGSPGSGWVGEGRFEVNGEMKDLLIGSVALCPDEPLGPLLEAPQWCRILFLYRGRKLLLK